MKQDLTVAIIGAGQIAGGYDQKKLDGDNGIYTHAGAYTAHGMYKLTTIYDIDIKQAGFFQEDWNVEKLAVSLTEVYKGYHDIVSVCTPDGTHFDVLTALLNSICCKTIFVEKPIALSLRQIEKVIELAHDRNINVVVNFQRQNERFHQIFRDQISVSVGKILAGNAYYIKGLEHIGITMVDTLTYLFDYPKEIFTYNRVFNSEINGFTYEFIFFYEEFNITVKTVDSNIFAYNYHIFEIDILFTDQRIIINDNSRQIITSKITNYAYAGIRTLNDREPVYEETGYKFAMLDAVDYLYKVTNGEIKHVINTPEKSWNNKFLINKIIESYESGQKINMEESKWKR